MKNHRLGIKKRTLTQTFDCEDNANIQSMNPGYSTQNDKKETIMKHIVTGMN